MLGHGIRRAAPDATVGRLVTLDAILSEQMATRRVTADVVGGFAFAAVALAVLGLYGLMAVTVAARMRETGVRLALGASPAEVARGVMLATLGHAGLGVAAGMVLAVAVGRFVQHLLVDVSAHDLRTLWRSSGSWSCWRRPWRPCSPRCEAARVDPASALRSDL